MRDLSIIIPAFNEAERIGETLDSIAAFLVERNLDDEVIVVDDGSTDQTRARALAVDDARVRVISHGRRQGKPVALNNGVAASSGSTLVFSDADVLLAPGSLKAMLARLAEDKVGIVGAGRSLAGADDDLAESEGLYWRYEQFIQARESALGACTAMSGAVLVMERDVFSPLPPDVINDDFYLAMQALRQGRRAVHEPSATAIVGVAADAAAERRRRSRIVAGRWQAMARAGSYLPWRRALPMWEVTSHKLLRPVVPFAFLIALAAGVAALLPGRSVGALLALRGPRRAVPLALQLLFLALAGLGSRRQSPSQSFDQAPNHASGPVSGVKGRVAKVLAVPAFLVSSNRAAISGTIGYIGGSQTARWQRSPSPHITPMSDAPGGKP